MQRIAQFRYREFTRAFKQAPWRVQTQLIATLAAAAVVVVALSGLYLASASRAATAGRDVQALQMQKAELELSVGRLQAQIGAAKSVNRLEARARELGYIPAQPDQVEYLVVRGYYSGVQQAAAASAQLFPDYNESLGTWLAHTLASFIRPGG